MRSQVGYVVPVDAVTPREAVELASLAEAAGFDGIMAADTFQPWLPSLGQAPHVWALMGAIAEHTRTDFGVGMAVPGGRMHPAALAQASATLAALHPRRHWISLAGGEALHEHVVGEYWAEAPERIGRVFDGVDLIKRLFAASAAGRDIRHQGPYFRMETSRLWTMPAQAPRLLVATSGPMTARRAGRSADGLFAVAVQPQQAGLVLERFREGASEAGRDPAALPAWLHLNLSWAATMEEARTNVLERYPMAAMRFARGDLRSPHVVEQIARMVRVEDFEGRLPVSADPEDHLEQIQSYLDLGYDRVFLHNVGGNQAAFLEAFGRAVLPKVG